MCTVPRSAVFWSSCVIFRSGIPITYFSLLVSSTQTSYRVYRDTSVKLFTITTNLLLLLQNYYYYYYYYYYYHSTHKSNTTQWQIQIFWRGEEWGRKRLCIVIYRKCTRRTICLLYRKRRWLSGKILSQWGEAAPTAPPPLNPPLQYMT